MLIGEGRINGIIGMAEFLKRLGEAGITYELASFDGGTAGNAIATTRSSVDEREKELLGSHKALAQEIGCEVEVTGRPTHSLHRVKQSRNASHRAGVACVDELGGGEGGGNLAVALLADVARERARRRIPVEAGFDLAHRLL